MYWTGSGRSRPMEARRRATVSGAASRPSTRMAGSPGRTRTTTKTSTDTKRRMAPMSAIPLRIERRTPSHLLPVELGKLHGRDGKGLPNPRNALLGHHEARMHVQPDHGRLVRHHPLQPGELLAAILVVHGPLGILV